jgi:predicted dehydrogenase
LALFKAEPTDATAFTSSVLSPAIADVAYAQYAFPHGRSAHIEVNWLDPEKGWRLDVFGTLGVLTLTETREHGCKLTLTPCGGRAANEGHELWRDPAVDVSIPAEEPLQAEVTAFINAVQHGSSYPTDAPHGVSVLRALALAERAARHTAKESLQTA